MLQSKSPVIFFPTKTGLKSCLTYMCVCVYVYNSYGNFGSPLELVLASAKGHGL